MTAPDTTTGFSEAPPTPESFTQVAVTKEVDFTALVSELRAALAVTEGEYLSVTLLDPPGSVEKPSVLSVGLVGRALTVDEVKAVVASHTGPATPAPTTESNTDPEVIRDPDLPE